MQISPSSAFALLLASTANHAQATDSRAFLDVVEGNWETVMQDRQVWVVKFESRACGGCRAFAPEFARAMLELKGLVKIGVVNIDEPSGHRLAKQLGVLAEGVPNVKLYRTSDGMPLTVQLEGDPAKAESVLREVFSGLSGLTQDLSGAYLKRLREPVVHRAMPSATPNPSSSKSSPPNQVIADSHASLWRVAVLCGFLLCAAGFGYRRRRQSQRARTLRML